MGNKIDLGIEEIVKRTSELEKVQDRLIPGTREIVRNCANAIKCMHAGEMADAKKFLLTAQKGLKSAQGEEKLAYLVSQAGQEVVEASILMAIIEGKKIPKAGELCVDDASYLNGVCDCVGELRRQMLEELKNGKKKEARNYFEIMDAIHEELMAIRFSDSLLRGFRQKQDVVRGQVERARSEIVFAGAERE